MKRDRIERDDENHDLMVKDLLSEAKAQAWDMIVIGTGMGGSALGWSLAEAGWRVLFVEMGRNLTRGRGYRKGYPDPDTPPAEAGRADWLLYEGDRAFRPRIGMGAGGSSALYGMVLERLDPLDFATETAFASLPAEERMAAALPARWPISYEEMAPWYEAAEMRLAGRASTPASPSFENLKATLQQQGAAPYAPALACRAEPGCEGCQDRLCHSSCKQDAAGAFLEPALDRPNARLLPATEALHLEASGRRITAVVVRHRNKEHRLAARHFAVAAGALRTPVLLADSQLPDRSGLLGRCLMRHAIDVYLLLRRIEGRVAIESKQIATRAWYRDEAGDKLGVIQGFGWPPPWEYLAQRPPWSHAARAGRWTGRVYGLIRNRLLIASILEDLPYRENRVWREGERIQYHYALGASERRRRRKLRALTRRLFLPYLPLRSPVPEDRAALGHACGTCRFGDDPGASVLDRYNRFHAMENLTVVDGSFFPTSGGVNPALTIAANALRVAGHLRRIGA
ncbi:MAG: GMC oxidoreductase [Bryobacteraceae bacterium]